MTPQPETWIIGDRPERHDGPDRRLVDGLKQSEGVRTLDFISRDILGLAGMRPQVVRPGMQALNEEREFEDARTQIISDLRRNLNANRDPKRALRLRVQAQQRLRDLGVEFQRRQAGGR